MNIMVSFTSNGINYEADIKNAALGYIPFSKQNQLKVRIGKSTTIDIYHINGKNPKNWEHYDVVDFDEFRFEGDDEGRCLTCTISSVTSATFR